MKRLLWLNDVLRWDYVSPWTLFPISNIMVVNVMSPHKADTTGSDVEIPGEGDCNAGFRSIGPNDVCIPRTQ